MAFANYTDFKAYIITFSHRDDLDSLIDDFIKMAEVRINADMKMLSLEQETTLTATSGSREITLPSDFNEQIALYLENIQPRQEVMYESSASLPYNIFTGYPVRYTIRSGKIILDRLADSAYTFTLHYRPTVALNSTDTTNAILTNYPDIYRAAVLREVSAYARDIEGIRLWDSAYADALASAQQQELGQQPVMLNADPLNTGTRFNINRGY